MPASVASAVSVPVSKPPHDAHNASRPATVIGHASGSYFEDSRSYTPTSSYRQSYYEAMVSTPQQNGDALAQLPALQVPTQDVEYFDPVASDDPQSYELVAPTQGEREEYSLEKSSQTLFSKEHLQVIFADSSLLMKFTTFLGTHRPQSVPILVHYLDTLKSLRALHYANAIIEGLDPIDGLDFTKTAISSTINAALEERLRKAFDVLVHEELPAFIAHQYIQIVSLSIIARITGSLAPHLRDASEGLAEVFCLTDPSRKDDPIVFASEEFNRTTQYGMGYVIGKNCRFLQGPMTNPSSVRRLRDAIAEGKQHQEVFLNYRRDGSPFMNLLMIAPLCDSRGIIRYHIGAQVDVSGLVKECSEMESLQRLLEMQSRGEPIPEPHKPSVEKNDELRELSEMLNQGELSTIRKYGGRMHRDAVDDDAESVMSGQPRLLLKDPTTLTPPLETASGKLSGVYQHYLLVRPYPSLRVLFASPSQRLPGLLQSPFMNKIGGSNRVREELTAALAEGRGVTAKVRWVSKIDEEGRNKWIHCTPLVGTNGQIGVWMVVIVDDEKTPKRWAGARQAPPVSTPERGRPSYNGRMPVRNGNGGQNGIANGYDREEEQMFNDDGSVTSLRIG